MRLWMRYRRAAMGGTRRMQPIRALVMLAATLASLSAGALVAPGPGTPTDQATPSLVQLGMEPGALRQAASLRPPVESPGPRPLPVPLLLGLLVMPLVAGRCGVRAQRLGPGVARTWRLIWLGKLVARAPPYAPA